MRPPMKPLKPLDEALADLLVQAVPLHGADAVITFDADGKAMGRPVGVAIDRTGALLVADDVGNKVWRAVPDGKAP